MLDRNKFVDRLVAIYGGERRYFERSAALTEHPGIDYHFRKGATDEWKSVLSKEQIERINRTIPDEHWTTFGWTP